MTASPRILQFQKDLLTLNCIPGILDGEKGLRTTNAAKDAAAQLHIPWVQGGSWDTFMDQIRSHVAGLPAPVVPLPPEFYDISKLAGLLTWIKGQRDWSGIDHLNIHQTGAPMGRDPERWLALRAHIGVTRAGEIYQIRRFLDWGYDAQGLSRKGIGIEISGFFLGEEGNPKTRPGGPKEWEVNSITPEQVIAVRNLIRYLVKLVAFHGGKITGIFPHRVATEDRTYDPGSLAWQEVGIEMRDELGLTDGGPGYIVPRSSGEPIPGCWEPTDARRAHIPLVNSRKVLGL